MRNIYILLILLVVTNIFGQETKYVNLSKEIEAYDTQLNYTASITKLHQVIYSKNSTAQDRTVGYYLKYQLYKKLGTYSEALTNLDLALADGLKTKEGHLIQIKYHLEKALLMCEKSEYIEAVQILNSVDFESHTLTDKYKGIYSFLLGIKAIEEENNYVLGLEHFEQSISLLEEIYPKYLTLVYKEQLRLYRLIGNDDKVHEAYKKGLEYAQTYQWGREILQLHRVMAEYYRDKGKNKESLELSELILVVSTRYNAVNVSANLNILERKLIEKDKELAIKKTVRVKMGLIIVSIVLLALIILYLYRYKKGVSKQRLILNENRNLRDSLDNLDTPVRVDKSLQVSALSERQQSILELVKAGKTNKEIASELFISENTVKYHLKIIYEALKIKGRSDLL